MKSQTNCLLVLNLNAFPKFSQYTTCAPNAVMFTCKFTTVYSFIQVT